MSAIRFSVTIGPVQLDISVREWCLLRTPGFPFALAEGFSSSELVARTADLLECERRLGQLREEFIAGHWPRVRRAAKHPDAPPEAPFRKVARLHRRVERHAELPDPYRRAAAAYDLGEWVDSWNSAVAQSVAAWQELERSYHRARGRGLRQVAARSEEPPVRHAVFVSNPAFYRNALADRSLRERVGEAQHPSRELRRTLFTLHRYLRRFASRCETVSFFGPVLYARLDPTQRESVRQGPPRPEAVAVEASTWLVEQLRQLADADTPVAAHRVWRSPLFRAVPGPAVERAMDGRRIRLPPHLFDLWQRADGRTVAELADGSGLDVSELVAALRLLGKSVTVTAHRIPATELAPLSRLAAAGSRHAAELAACRDRYARDPWPARVGWRTQAQELVAGWQLPERQGAGRHYADREIFYEDRASPYSERLTLGGPALAGLTAALRAVLPLSYLVALLAREDARESVREVLAGSDGSFAWLAGQAVPERSSRVDRLREALAALVRRGSDASGAPVALTSDEVAAAVAPCWALVPPAARADACLPSPDLMAVGPDPGTATWVLSELHDDCSTIYGGLEQALHSAPRQLWQEFVAAVAAVIPPEESATVCSRRRTAHVTPELPGCSIELSGVSGGSDPVPICEVGVPATADGVSAGGRLRRLYPGDLSSPAHRALARPAVARATLETGIFTPRILIDQVVYQRARWRLPLPSPAGGSAPGRWVEAQRLRRQHRLPDRVFVRHPAEPKPLYVDLDDPLAVDDLMRLPAGEIVVTEMLPDRDQLWWRVDGASQCAELRVGCLVAATPVAEGRP